MVEATDLKVLLADDQAPVLAGMKRAIEPHGLRVVAEASNAEDAVRLALAWEPDVCVLAITLPGHGIEAARRIKQSLPATKVVMITAVESEEDLFSALRAGADDYMLMSTPAHRLPQVIRAVIRGEAVLPRRLTARLIAEFRERGTRRRLVLPSAGGEVELTAREFEVLERLRRGDRTSEIAARLGISEVTIRRHVASVLRKLGMPNRRSAVELLEQAETEQLPRASSD
jgi:DNA-binding NarL/FixJ family response regulator